LSGVIAYFMGQFYRKVGPIGGHQTHVALTILCSAVGGFALVLLCLQSFGSVNLLFTTVFTVIKQEVALFLYLALILAAGLFFISQMQQFHGLFRVRKMFHGLAFVLFLPPIANASLEPPKLMVLAFNCVSVAMLILEGLRFHDCLPGGLNQSMTSVVKHFSGGFERQRDTLVITQIYLLMGCAFPLCASFILTGGGVMTTTWTLYSLAGVVFLGVGDTAAALGGRAYGVHKWRDFSNKTTHGTSYCIISCTAVYYVLCSVID
jgi:dolichol kinase